MIMHSLLRHGRLFQLSSEAIPVEYRSGISFSSRRNFTVTDNRSVPDRRSQRVNQLTQYIILFVSVRNSIRTFELDTD